MLLIYTHKINNRIKYIFNLIFHDLLKIEFRITNNSDEFKAYQEAKINYSFQHFDDELFFYSSSLLFENGFATLLWEDQTPLLREMAARLILARGSLEGLGCTTGGSGQRPGYYLLVARKV